MIFRSFKIVCLIILALNTALVYPNTWTSDITDDDTRFTIVPKDGFNWPQKKRTYWPTRGWRKSTIHLHGINPAKISLAEKMAENDPFFRSLLVIKDGFLVYEKYFHGGAKDQSTEVWSVTKSITSILIGIALYKGYLKSIDQSMVDYLPEYPQFKNITIRNVLTHTTGLNWNEGSLQSWIQSKDWIAHALNKGFYTKPGTTLHYSSGNSHFLSKLIKKITGKTPGEFAAEYLFKPLGINYKKMNKSIKYKNWNEIHVPIPGSWRKGNQGLEIGAFGLHLTARDMAKIGFLYLNKGKWDGRTIVSEEWVEESTRDRVLKTNSFGFGYHWVVAKRAGHISFDADGWGGQHISVIPALDMIVVIKCDAVNPGGKSSYQVLRRTIEANK